MTEDRSPNGNPENDKDLNSGNVPVSDPPTSAIDRRLNAVILVLAAIAVLVIVAGTGYFMYESSGQTRLSVVDKEIEEVKKQVQADFQNPNGHIRLAELYMEDDDLESAISELKVALRFGKDHPRALLDLGLIYQQRKEYGLAEKQYEKMIKNLATGDLAKVNELLASAHFQLGVMYYDQKKYEKALKNFGQTLLINQSDADSFYFVAKILYQMGSYDVSIRSYQTALQFDPNFIDAHLGLAQVFEATGEKEKAKAEYEFVVSNDPSNKAANDGLARVQ